MEGETPSAAETVPPENMLKELAANETSLIALIKTLLSPKTLPHPADDCHLFYDSLLRGQLQRW